MDDFKIPKNNELVSECMCKLDEKHDNLIETDGEAEIYKKVGSLYWKKYWALRRVVKDLIDKEDIKELSKALQYLEWRDNSLTKIEMQDQITKEVKK